MLNVVKLSITMLNVAKLSVIMLNVVMLNAMEWYQSGAYSSEYHLEIICKLEYF
jgi:hypothetical protein